MQVNNKVTYCRSILTEIAIETKRPKESVEKYIQILENEWFEEKEDLLAIDNQLYEQLKIPKRLVQLIKQKLQSQSQNHKKQEKFIDQNNQQLQQNVNKMNENQVTVTKSQREQDENIQIIIKEEAKLAHLRLIYRPTNLKEFSSEQVEQSLVSRLFKHTSKNIKIFAYPNSATYKRALLVQNENGSNQQNNDGGQQFNSAKNCFFSLHLPLKNDSEVRDKIIRFDKKFLRTGKILEILDLIAGQVSYCFIYFNSNDFAIVTACVDNIEFFQQLDPYEDLEINGYPTFVGKSSIEIKIDFIQNNQLSASAYAVMVAKQKNRQQGKQIPQLVLEEEGEELKLLTSLFQIGKENSEVRKANRITQFLFPINLTDQHQEIHELLLSQQMHLQQQISLDYLKVSETIVSKTLPMHIQDKNIHWKIFGGYIMREAFELGTLAAIDVSRGFIPVIQFIDDVQFILPVDIGSVMKFEAQVCSVYQHFAYIQVDCIKVTLDADKNCKKYQKTNELKLIFDVGADCKQVIPVSYFEVTKYIHTRDTLKKKIDLCKQPSSHQHLLNK